MTWRVYGVDANPTVAGEYNVQVENIMFCGPEYWYFDGVNWDIPEHFSCRKFEWYEEKSVGEVI